MKFKDIQTEEKVRLDPKCWTGKKIGNPKTKMKGGVRVNNCVPAESVEEAANPAQQAAIAIAKKKKKQGVAEAATPASVSKVMRLIDRRHPEWFDNYGMGEVEDTVVDMAEMGQFQGMSAVDALALVGQELESMYGQQGMAEDYNPEYDDEAGMADNNLETLQRAVEGIDDLIQSGDNLPEWCQEKIAVAKSMLVAVWDYMYSEEASDEVDPEVDEMFEAMDQLAEEMAAKNRVSKDLVWEQFEALPDRVLYETAAWRRKEGKSKKGGLNAKGVASYRRENPGSKLQMAVTTKPSKLKKGSKAAKRRKSFCARMGGVKGPMKKPNGKPTRKALALRKWNC
jgi:hypothetical protein